MPVPALGAIGLFSRGIWKTPNIGAFLDAPIILKPRANDPRITAAAGWGRKASGERAGRYAALHGIDCLRLEDGFLRSMELGAHGAPPLSIVVDDLGIYFDATRPSRLEVLLNGDSFPPGLLSRAERVLEKLLAHNLSKYNHAPDAPDDVLGRQSHTRVLVIDQTANDDSIRYGLANEASFRSMLEAAIAENPGADIYIKTHPDVIAGKKPSALANARGRGEVRWIGEQVSPLSLVRQVARVYTVTSLMGFEALMLGKPVTCFGMPFYAGWGVTDDRVTCPRRSRRRSMLEILAAAYILYARYVDPVTGQRCEVERVVDYLALQRERFANNSGRFYCFGFSFWKRGYVRPFLSCPGNAVHFVRSADQARRKGFDSDARILVWGSREPQGMHQLADAFKVPIWRMEDGFIRSVGLGSDFVRPWSLVVDKRGIYFDPSAESDLENLLNRAGFSEELVQRALEVREFIAAHRITKYNTESDQPLVLETEGRRVILVPGQVEDDASIVKGAGTIRTNSALLRAVRCANPQAFLIYKPHPDALARNRAGARSVRDGQAAYDHLEATRSIIRCIEVAQEVHTMTSLSGFDALLRGKRVVTYGAPFYAGWGLTHDQMSIPRRQRVLSLDELVAGVLLLYPRYWDAEARGFVELEDVLRKIIRQREAVPRGAPDKLLGYLGRQLRKWTTYAQAVWLSCQRSSNGQGGCRSGPKSRLG